MGWTLEKQKTSKKTQISWQEGRDWKMDWVKKEKAYWGKGKEIKWKE